MNDSPFLSAETVAVLVELLGNVQLPVSHPQFEEVAAVWGKAKRELAELSQYYTETR